jgi:hypothetical protein
MSTDDLTMEIMQLRAALSYYAKPRIYGVGEHSVFIDDTGVAEAALAERKGLGGLLDGPLHNLAGEMPKPEVYGAGAPVASLETSHAPDLLLESSKGDRDEA